MANQYIPQLGYLVSIVLFIIGIKRLAKVKTARSANAFAAGAMLLAIISQLLELGALDYKLIAVGVIVGSAIGIAIALSVAMTNMPQLVAVLNGFGGGASMLVALSIFTVAEKTGSLSQSLINGMPAGNGQAITLVLSVIIGGVTLSGSMLAYLKLSDKFGSVFGGSIMFPLHHFVSAMFLLIIVASSVYWVSYVSSSYVAVLFAIIISVLSLVLGVFAVLPIGGADMPVVISLLNSYSGLAASATGFALGSNVLIVSGALVGASGIILTKIMCDAMNRSLASVILGGFGTSSSSEPRSGGEYVNVKCSDVEEAVLDFEEARNVIIVPGYGLAVSRGQNAVADFAAVLQKRGAKVKYAVHPVAGRMPGHMNVLLAESNVPYDDICEMDEINREFKNADVAIVVGANDVVNPAAREDKNSPLYGMPILDVDHAAMVYVIKRSLSPGFAGVKNELFEKNNCRMIYGDAKKVLEDLTVQLERA
ncbi:MAG: NAD(P)(+) transhydrogenase (Re/Si-specific) subunit beta [Deltaproteobacteria bacterium]|nr:NAD(P)(+) transhydrogenase (Re/Si-specific) subunit beta [Deltaproteobacteria bacterium]